MLIKALLKKLVNSSEFMVRRYNKTNLSISGGGVAVAFNNENIEVAGYKALGIVEIYVGGSGYTSVVPQRWALGNNQTTLGVGLRNVTSSAVTLGSINVAILYQKLGGY